MKYSSDFSGELRGDYAYLFFIVEDSYSRQPDSLDQVQNIFASNLGQRGAVVASFPDQRSENYGRLMLKSWPQETGQQLENLESPKLLVVAKDFSDFDPSEDRFSIIDFADYGGDPETIRGVLRQVESTINGGDDFFEWWGSNCATFRLSDERLEQLREIQSADSSSLSREELLNSKLSFTIPEAAWIAGVDKGTIHNHLQNQERYLLRRNNQGRITQESLKQYLRTPEE